jgi:chromosome partitioning protein
MHERHTNLAREVVDDLENFFTSARNTDVPWRNCRVLQPAIRRNIKLAEAPSFGQTIFQYEPTSRGADDYKQLAACVLEGWQETPGQDPDEMVATDEPDAPVSADATEVQGTP